MSDVRENRSPQSQVSDDAAAKASDGLVLHEERLVTGQHEKRETGQIRLRKRIVVEEVTVTVPVRREVVDVVRVDADGRETVVDAASDRFEARVEDRTGHVAGTEGKRRDAKNHETKDGAFVVTCYEERPVLTTEIFAVEQVRLDTSHETRTETVTVDLQHEEAELVEEPRRS